MTTPIKILDELIDEYSIPYNNTQERFIQTAFWNRIEALKEAKERIEALGDWWVSVEDRFPEDNTMVLAYIDFIVWVNLWWATESWEWKWDWWIKYTHWMPLPTPPNQ